MTLFERHPDRDDIVLVDSLAAYWNVATRVAKKSNILQTHLNRYTEKEGAGVLAILFISVGRA